MEKFITARNNYYSAARWKNEREKRKGERESGVLTDIHSMFAFIPDTLCK